MVAELVWPCQLCCGTIVRACHMPGDGLDIFQREQRNLLGSGIRPSARSVSCKVLLTTENHHICMVVAELVRPVNSAAERLYELATCRETVVIYFSASRGVSLVAELDKVRGQFSEKVLLTTKKRHICMVAELVRPAHSAAERLYELITCQETVVIYFSASRGVCLVAEYD